MNNIRKLFLTVCFIVYLIPTYGQKDTITADGLFLKYNTPRYHGDGATKLTMEKIRNNDLYVAPFNDSDMVRGELERVTKRIGISYKALSQYIISETFRLEYPPINPTELHRTTGNEILSQWIHTDGECILFIQSSGSRPTVDRYINEDGKRTITIRHGRSEPIMDKSVNELPENTFSSIKYILTGKTSPTKMTEQEMQKIKETISIWSPEKAKGTFNAQYVIICPIKNKKSVYMGKYTHKLKLMMIKWGESLSVSFLVTKKGYKNIDKYIKDVEGAFSYED